MHKDQSGRDDHLKMAQHSPDAARTALEASRESVQLLGCLADLATSLWRAQKSLDDRDAEPTAVIRRVGRHVESALMALEANGIEIRQYLNEPYSAGMAASVLAFQPTPGLNRETIQETLKPSIFFRDILIQRAELIVGVPDGATAQATPGTDERRKDESENGAEA